MTDLSLSITPIMQGILRPITMMIAGEESKKALANQLRRSLNESANRTLIVILILIDCIIVHMNLHMIMNLIYAKITCLTNITI